MTKFNTLTPKRFFFAAILIIAALSCNAQPISPMAARQKAHDFMQQLGMPHADGIRRVAAQPTSTETAPYYVFNASDNAGFVIVAGDERAEAIMGYSLEGGFDEANIPVQMKAWLAGCAQELEALQQGKMTTRPMHVANHKAVGKLMKSVWGQGEASAEGEAFNQLCPTIDGKHCYSGCVATAMAQVMRYNRWPTTFCSEIPAYESNEHVGKLSKLPKAKFDWGNMLDKYDEGQPKVSCDAVAQLMLYCGYSVEMDYGTDGSSAQNNLVAKALRTYFGYDINTRYARRSDYTIESWDELIYNEMSQGRPVVYAGSNPGGGHSFVIDGYDGNGFYHVNWGWYGYCDGFYKLAILNPEGGGTGSSSANCGYSDLQGAVVGIQPPTNFNDDMRTLSLEDFYTEGHTIYGQFANRTGMDGTFEYGFAYHNINTESGSYHVANQTDYFDYLDMRTVSANLDDWGLGNGTYRFYPYTILEGSGWYRVPGDFMKYIEVTVSGGKITNMTYHPLANMTIVDFACKGNLIVDMPQEIAIKVKSNTEEYFGPFYLFASQTNEKGEFVDKVILPIEAGGESETSLYFKPNAVGKWKVWIDINEEGSNNLSPIELTIKKAPTSKTNLAVTRCDIVAKEDVTFKVRVKNQGSEGYYKPIYCYIFEDGKRYSVAYDIESNTNIAAGATAELEFRIEGLEMNKTYMMAMMNFVSHQSKETDWLGGTYSFTVGADLNPDAIGEVTVAAGLPEPADVYTVAGSLVRKEAGTLEGLPKGIYIVKGRKYVVR